MKNTNNNTAANITAAQLLALADKPEYATAECFHELWEQGKAKLPRNEQDTLWEGLKARSLERKIGIFAGKKYLAAHPGAKASTPNWAGKKADAPAKQEKAPAKKAPAKQEKPANDMTTKEALARIFEELVKIDKRVTAIEKKIAK